ncbi:MAG: DNA-directed RNA polymerase subunit A' [Candidatus Diapherotrites archaeon]|nr:DNA-directed RNA polymerase subunit A' [Candidatus Diapherotrites archaeon]
MLLKKIANIEFSVLGPEMIRKMSALEVKTPETYDKDGYPMEGGLMDPHLGVINPGLRCKTCGQQMKTCPGHFGHLNLVRPVAHSEFSKKIEELMHATCQSCGRIALSDEKLNELKALMNDESIDISKRILIKTKKAKKCPHCSGERPQVLLDKPTNFYLDKDRIYPTQIRDWMEKIPSKDLELFGYNSERVRPEWFVLTTLQVPPINIRPSITLESGIKSEDDLTHKLVDIIRINIRLKDNIEAGAPQLIIEDLWDLLQYHVTTYFDNNTAGVPPAKHRSGRALRTLVQRLKGKRGRFRYNLTGKRVNFAARSTISPDPYLSIDEVGVPELIAKELTVPEFVTEWNEKAMKKMLKEETNIVYVIRPNGQRKKVNEENRKEIEEELAPGFKVERTLQNGDVVLFNRQPSLHRISMMAHYARIMPNKTFRLNPTACKPYNADFDGDEMNLHVPQTEEGKAEAKNLMLCSRQIISPRHGGPVIVMDEDMVSGCFTLTLASTKFDREETMKILYDLGFSELPEPDIDGKYYSGKLIFSQMLPKDLNLEFESYACGLVKRSGLCKECKKEACGFDAFVKIKNGKLSSGVIDSAALGERKGAVVDTIFRDYGPDALEKFYRGMCRLAPYIITKKGMTAGIDEYQTSENVEKLREELVAEELEETGKLVEEFKKGTLESIPGKTLPESFETKMMVVGAKMRSKIEKLILKEKIEQTLTTTTPHYNTAIIILSKAKGSPLNLTNMSGFLGQVSVREGRPRRGFKGRLNSINRKGDIGAIAGGFVQNNFVQGLNIREFFVHSMGGRQGEVDTSVATKVSGYLYRRLANSLKDLMVDNDETVRTANKNLIQFVYGEDSVFPMKAVKGKSLNVEKILAKETRESKK